MKKGIKRMIADIEDEVALTAPLTGISHFDPQVMKAMAEVPREAFVPPELRAYAFDDGPLPIGHGQTISQPYIVALMTHLLKPQPRHRILEVGTGSGYQTAILSRLVEKVYSIEVVPELARQASELFSELGYNNIETTTGNGYQGWPEQAPYDGIVVTAAASHVPPPLIEQLKPGGRLVVPVGQPYSHQELFLIKKDTDGKVHHRNVLGVAFVPLQQEPADGPHRLH